MRVPATIARKRLLTWLIDLANNLEGAGEGLASIIRGKLTEDAGPLRQMIKEADRYPVLYLGGIDVDACAWEDVQTEAVRLLERLCEGLASGGGAHGIEDEFNRQGVRCKVLAARPQTDVQGRRTRADPWGPTILVPWAMNAQAIPLYVLLVARSTKTSEGGTLADRVARCRECGKFFLRKTRQTSYHCSASCRWTAVNRSRPMRPRRSRKKPKP